MRTAPLATLALSATCALLAGGMTLLDGSATPAVGTAAFARPTDQLPRAVRRTKADREPVRGGLTLAAFTGEPMSGADLRPLGADPQPDSTIPVFGRMVIDGALRQEIDGALNAEILDDTEGLDESLAALSTPVEAPARRIEVPLPPEKPAHAALAPAGGPSAQRASLFASSQRAPANGGTAPASRFGFFSNIGVAQQAEVKLAALTPPAADGAGAGRTPGISVPTPFGVPYVLQTEGVDAACLKPQLLDLLRGIERHYGQKVVMTSGERSRGREGSLHKSCQAADIIVPGVEAEALARYARGVPGMGGVGTYCHPNMIHVDIGSPRDWHYGCGKSYFAMRDGGSGTASNTGPGDARTLAGRTRMTVTE